MYNSNANEQEILEYWKKNKTFEKSVSQRPEDKPYVFYDGPPFATGTPHYGHFPSSIMKDVVPRYWTMNGYRVERVWGWDCHGLPIENIVEKELGTKSKKEIEAMGVAKFNELCRSKVFGYVEEWEKTIRRLGRWVDMQHAYRTMDIGYMESVWWVFKQLWDKGLVYEDYRSMHICPRCETTLSQQEVAEGYKEVKDISVIVKFKLKNAVKYNLPENTYVLAWTTTPWTLPGNVLLAVGEDIEYWILNIDGEDGNYVVAKERVEAMMKDKQYQKVKQLKGVDLVGLEYEPLFPYYKNTKNAFRVVVGDFVTTTDGTGIVHIAPAFGDDDFKVGKREDIPLVAHVGMDGRMKSEVTDFVGMEVKPRSDDDKVRLGTDIAVIKYLQEHGVFFAKQNITHTYPHCWRCDTPLLNYATSSWFVKVTEIKERALKLAKKINWSPEHIKEGRFGKWLEGARDWSISRQRFWASVMPVWNCVGCEKYQVFGSVAELEKASGKKVTDLHKHIVDEITFPCEKCGGVMKRIPDVLDTWFDSGSMPYAQVHYPFENKKKFEDSFPAEFIGEGQDQTRAWFYYLHVLSTALFGKIAFKNVIVNGIVLAEDGKKMSKRLKNYPDPNMILEKYGADALRYYMLTSPVVRAENMNFSEVGVREMYNKVVNTLSNVLEFYNMYVGSPVILSAAPSGGHPQGENKDPLKLTSRDSLVATLPQNDSKNVLDRWILTKLQVLIKEVTENMERYELAEASRPIGDFITELSQWYVRRSRDRFKGEDVADKAAAVATLRTVLLTLSKIMAPFTPFIAEKIYLELTGGKEKESVHLEQWPSFGVIPAQAGIQSSAAIDEKVLKDMATARVAVEMGLALRAQAGVKVRQVLGRVVLENSRLAPEYLEIVKDELNVKEVLEEKDGAGKWVTKDEGVLKISLDLEITPELKKEGLAREIVRAVNQTRKEQGLTVEDKVTVVYETADAELAGAFEQYSNDIKLAVLATDITAGTGETELIVDGRVLRLKIAKV